jgi:hypothetical protein
MKQISVSGKRSLNNVTLEKKASFSSNNNILKVEKDDVVLHPNTLQIVSGGETDSIYLSNYYFDNTNNLKTVNKNYNDNVIFHDNYMTIPNLLLNPTEFIKVFNVSTIDDLLEYINLNLDKMLFASINRVVNIWIRNNLNDLKKHNEILIKIYTILFNHYYPKINLNNNIIKSFIKKWIKNKNNNLLFLNLGNDLYYFLINNK